MEKLMWAGLITIILGVLVIDNKISFFACSISLMFSCFVMCINLWFSVIEMGKNNSAKIND